MNVMTIGVYILNVEISATFSKVNLSENVIRKY